VYEADRLANMREHKRHLFLRLFPKRSRKNRARELYSNVSRCL
jgi:hypothetical protein